MKYFDWNSEKNEKLKEERGISFEIVVDAIENGQVLAIIKHPNQKRYPKQKQYIVEIEDYAYLVPFVEEDEHQFLKTIIPSSKMTKKYLYKGGVIK